MVVPMGVTLSMIAREVGVSVATVSLVLTGKTGRFQAATATAVQAAAVRLGYRPNSSARATRTGRFGCVALLHHSAGQRSHLPGRLLDGIAGALEQAGLRLALGTIDDSRLEQAEYLPHLLGELSADGLLINYHKNFPVQMQEALDRSQVPAVWINAEVPGMVVKPDDRACGRIATEHLLGLGHRRIAYADFANDIVTGRHFSAIERRVGYSEAMRAVGLEPSCRGNPERLPHAGWRGLAAAWLAEPDPPTAVVCYSIGTGMHVLVAALAERRLRVPGDLSLVVIADDTTFANNLPIDAVVLPWQQVGARAVDLLLVAIAGGEATALPDPPGSLVVVGSSSPPGR